MGEAVQVDEGFQAALAEIRSQKAALEAKPEAEAVAKPEAKAEAEQPAETAPEATTEAPKAEDAETKETEDATGEKPSRQLLALVKQEKKIRAQKQELKELQAKVTAEAESLKKRIAEIEAKDKELENFREALHRDPVGTIDEVLKRTSKIGLDELIKTREDPVRRELMETRRELSELKRSLEENRDKQPEDRKPAPATNEDARAWDNYLSHVTSELADPKLQHVKRFAEKRGEQFQRLIFNEVVTYWNKEGHLSGKGLSPAEAVARVESMLADILPAQETQKSPPIKTISQSTVGSNPNKERDDDEERFHNARLELKKLMAS